MGWERMEIIVACLMGCSPQLHVKEGRGDRTDERQG